MGGQYHRNGVIDPGVNITGMNDPVLKKIRKFINMGGVSIAGMGGQLAPEWGVRLVRNIQFWSDSKTFGKICFS
jgi:hypothetical protein